MNKSFKEKVKENRGKILTSVIFGVTIISGGYIILSKNKQINILEEQIKQNTEDIELLKDVMSKDVIGTLKQSLTNKLRYHEGRLNNGIKSNTITEADKQMHKETINFVNNQLLKLAKAEERLDNK
jgi:aminoglycoside phosphotransferase family enzyme